MSSSSPPTPTTPPPASSPDATRNAPAHRYRTNSTSRYSHQLYICSPSKLSSSGNTEHWSVAAPPGSSSPATRNKAPPPPSPHHPSRRSPDKNQTAARSTKSP